MNDIETVVNKTKTFIEDLLLDYVSEYNDEPTRKLIIETLNKFIKVPEKYDYQVVCDVTNNTPEIIDNNELVIDTYFQPAQKEEPPVNPNYHIYSRLNNKYMKVEIKKDSKYVTIFKEKIRGN